MYDHILLAVDGSDEAKQAAKRGLEFARDFDATVDVLHVVEKKALRLTKTADEADRLRERGETILEDIQSIASDVGHSVTMELTEGEPARRIAEYAADRGATLIVVGRQGVTSLGKRLLGGVTEGLLRRSDVPVLVVPEEDRTTGEAFDYSRLLLPTDGSENADTAIDHGVAVARQYGSIIHVLNVIDLQASGGVFDVGGLEKELVERLEANGAAIVDEVAAEIDDVASDVTVETAVERTTSFDGVAAGISEYVTDNDIDLIAMGARGRSNLGRHLLGSVASNVLRTVDVPVLIVTRSP
ncbi:universal stress protein [Natrinema amylolyticum]|uniref:universal stress protein n=1 Tax=Natrinema amylolyticum TaxID=2878679 RepID=UPI001CFB708C|nr:universal stress protein [Natrinema amylolyticum]